MASFGISVSIPDDHLAFLTNEAHGKGISVQQLIRNIIVNYMIMKKEHHDDPA